MNKIYEDAKDLHVRVVLIYQGTSAGATKAFVDAACTTQAKTSELKDAFIKGCLIKLAAGGFVKPFQYTESEGVGSVSYIAPSGSTAAVAALAAVADSSNPS